MEGRGMETQEGRVLKRGLKRRHLTMIAIGGSIGTGLFLAMGGTIRDAGPGGAMVAYAVMGIVVYFMMTALGEMATRLPIPGAFTSYADRFIDKAWGFTNGWSYWFGSAMTVAAELIAGAIIIKYWFPNSNSSLWAMLFLAILLAINLFTVKGFGEAEYWFAGIKVIVTIVFLIVSVLMILGIMSGTGSQGFSNWTLDGGSEGKAPFIHGRNRRYLHGRSILFLQYGTGRAVCSRIRKSEKRCASCSKEHFLTIDHLLSGNDLRSRDTDTVYGADTAGCSGR